MYIKGQCPYPPIQKPHLLLSMKPVLAAVHDGQRGMVRFCKGADGVKRNQFIFVPIKNAGRNAPLDGVALYVAKPFPS